MIPNGAQMAPSSNNMMESLKSNMMTMLMINTMNHQGGGQGQKSGNQDMFSMMYIFIATNVVDFVFKQIPVVTRFFMKNYTDKLETIHKGLSSTTTDLTDNKIKKKTASITVTINVNHQDNILGQALLDYITNNKNTTHVSYVFRCLYIIKSKELENCGAARRNNSYIKRKCSEAKLKFYSYMIPLARKLSE